MRIRRLLPALLIAVLLFGFLREGRADEVYTFVVKKQEEKAKSRWTLAEWLATRDRMRLMDLWLALHSPSPYEFYVGAEYQWNKDASQASYNASEFAAAAYASIFGLGVESESSPNDSRWTGLFFLRVFGFHAQGTNITLQLGLKNTNNGVDAYRNALLGVGMSVYILRYFGLDGSYRHFLDSTPTSSGTIYSGGRYEAGAFIDFKFLRVFGNYFNESELASTRSGVSLGTKLFF